METIKVRRYSLSFKQAIVREYESGESLTFLNRKYGVGRPSLKRWVEQYGRNGTRHKLMVIQHPEDQNRMKELEQRIADLEHALAESQLDRLMLSACLTVAEEQYGVDVKKTREQLLLKQRKQRRTKNCQSMEGVVDQFRD